MGCRVIVISMMMLVIQHYNKGFSLAACTHAIAHTDKNRDIQKSGMYIACLFPISIRDIDGLCISRFRFEYEPFFPPVLMTRNGRILQQSCLCLNVIIDQRINITGM